MAIQGIFASHSGIVGDRVGDLASRVLMTGYTGTAPLLALTAGMPKEEAVDSSYSWVEDSHISGNTTAAADKTSSETDLVVADSNIWTPNSIIMNQSTGEYMLVTAISGNTCTIIRGAFGTTAAAVTTNDIFQSIGTAFEEGGGKPSPVAQRGESRTNYVQIFKNGWSITGTAKKIKFKSGDQLAQNRSQALGFHVEDLERAFMFGRPFVTTLNNGQLRTTGGVKYYIETYGGLVQAAAYGGNAGEMALHGTGGLIDFMRQIFDRNVKGLPNERITFTGSAVVALINEMVKKDSTYNIEMNETGYGVKVMTLSGFNGSLSLMTHPLFTENSIWGHELQVLHPGLIKKRVLRDTWEESFGAGKSNNAGVDAEEGFIAVEQGIEVKAVETMGIMTNIQTAVASA